MLELTDTNVVDYLHRTGRLSPEIPANAQLLAWGVSNLVVRIHPDSGPDFVVKQSREKLRTRADWFSRLDRIWREVDALRVLGPLLPAGAVPRVLFEDRENFAFGMEAVDAGHVVWKQELLEGVVDPAVGLVLAGYLAAIHRRTAGDARIEKTFGDRQVFDELRIDPFYRRIAEVHPALRPRIAALIDEMSATAVCLVHADFSPKNVLLTASDISSASRAGDASAAGARRVTLVDFETVHYGDPAFDLGFFLSHLLLKCVRLAPACHELLGLVRSFWEAYRKQIALPAGSVPGEFDRFAANELEQRTLAHLGACLLSRIDGKSTIDYLPADEQQNLVRRFAAGLLQHAPPRLTDALGELEQLLTSA